MSSNNTMENKKVIPSDEEENCDDDCQYIFPQRLMSILGDERNHEAICWLPHGRAFIIRNRKLFAERIMPKFFPRKSKYSSFTRKLNRWNFVRVSSGPELGAYYHEFFLRDKPHLAAQMFCKNARTKIAMASSDPNPATALANKSESKQQVKETPKEHGVADAARLLLMRQQMDPALQVLLEQQVSLGQQHVNTQLRQRQLQQQLQQQSILNLLQGGSSAGPSAALVLEMQMQKQQQERLIQLQQLMALNNLKRQQQRKNNFRASAA